MRRHLGITSKPQSFVTTWRNCLPHYQLGHTGMHAHRPMARSQLFFVAARVAAVSKQAEAACGPTLKLLGPSYGFGIGVNDCIRGAREHALRL